MDYKPQPQDDDTSNSCCVESCCGQCYTSNCHPGNASRKIALNADVHVAIVQIVIVEYHGARLRNSFAKLTGRSLTSLES